MRALEFLVEYSRSITAQALGSKLVQALLHDHAPVPANMHYYKTIKITDENRENCIDTILSCIESRDPTPHKEYTQWLARMYATGTCPFEDLNRHNLLSAYHMGKRRHLIKPEHADINRFKTYEDFESTMADAYDLGDLYNIKTSEFDDKGNAKEVYQDETVRVIAPQDEAAACYYGRGTKWCTTDNAFYSYYEDGPLYILIPKKPSYPGEKYQLHFETRQYRNEQDKAVSLEYLFNRFPSIRKIFAFAAQRPAR